MTTILGFLTAGVLPTISLLVGSMSSSGRSVLGVSELHDELSDAIGSLWQIVWLVLGAALFLFFGSVSAAHLSGSVAEVVGRATQGFVTSSSTTALILLRQVPAMLQRALHAKFSNAIDEARMRIDANAPDRDTVSAMFPTTKEFGRVVRMPIEGK